MRWNQESLDRLALEWSAGKRSSREIAVDFGCSRNSIIGVVYRHQMKRDVTDIQRTIFQNKTRRKRTTDRVYPKRAPIAIKPEPIETSEYAVGFFEIGPCQCRYPLHAADPTAYHLVYCGTPTDGGPWCDYHADKVFMSR